MAGEAVARARSKEWVTALGGRMAAVAGVATVGLVAGTAVLSGSAAAAGAPRGAGIGVKTSHHAVSARPAVARLAPRHGRFLGIMPSGSARFKNVARTANGTPPLVYHGGPVQHSETVYAIFWAPAGHYLPGSYRSTVAQYFGDVAHDSYGTGNVYAASTQYYDNTGPAGKKNWVSYNVTYAGAVVDTDTVPASGCTNYTLGDFSTTFACLLDSQLQTEVSKVVSRSTCRRGSGSSTSCSRRPAWAAASTAGRAVPPRPPRARRHAGAPRR
jgi:hypothetical protein